MKAILKRNILHSGVLIKAGEVGKVADIAQVENPVGYYDCYVEFDRMKPIGLFREEVEIKDGAE